MIQWTKAEKVVLPIALLIIIAITLLVWIGLRKRSEKVRKLPLIIIAVLMLAMELVKQGTQIDNYSMWSIPLHFCSAFMIWFSLASFSKGKLERIGFSMSFACGMLFFLMFYIAPGTIIGNSSANLLGSFGAFHTFVYHHLITLFIFLSVSLRFYNPKLKDLPIIVAVFSLYAFTATVFAHTFNVNFTNLLYSNIPFMQSLLNSYGYIIYTTIMYLFGTVSVIAIITISYYIKKALINLSEAKQKE